VVEEEGCVVVRAAAGKAVCSLTGLPQIALPSLPCQQIFSPLFSSLSNLLYHLHTISKPPVTSTMAEVLAVAGGISSFLTIAEVASKLVRGCVTLIKDAKNAPKDVRKLVEELESLSKVAEGIERIVRDTENLELRAKVDEAVRLALERCVEVVEVLTKILDEYVFILEPRPID